ncbi:hypothetical protein HDU93_002133, partial [Gonapodya sp. JEL0774]
RSKLFSEDEVTATKPSKKSTFSFARIWEADATNEEVEVDEEEGVLNNESALSTGGSLESIAFGDGTDPSTDVEIDPKFWEGLLEGHVTIAPASASEELPIILGKRRRKRTVEYNDEGFEERTQDADFTQTSGTSTTASDDDDFEDPEKTSVSPVDPNPTGITAAIVTAAVAGNGAEKTRKRRRKAPTKPIATSLEGATDSDLSAKPSHLKFAPGYAERIRASYAASLAAKAARAAKQPPETISDDGSATSYVENLKAGLRFNVETNQSEQVKAPPKRKPGRPPKTKTSSNGPTGSTSVPQAGPHPLGVPINSNPSDSEVASRFTRLLPPTDGNTRPYQPGVAPKSVPVHPYQHMPMAAHPQLTHLPGPHGIFGGVPATMYDYLAAIDQASHAAAAVLPQGAIAPGQILALAPRPGEPGYRAGFCQVFGLPGVYVPNSVIDGRGALTPGKLTLVSTRRPYRPPGLPGTPDVFQYSLGTAQHWSTNPRPGPGYYTPTVVPSNSRPEQFPVSYSSVPAHQVPLGPSGTLPSLDRPRPTLSPILGWSPAVSSHMAMPNFLVPSTSSAAAAPSQSAPAITESPSSNSIPTQLPRGSASTAVTSVHTTASGVRPPAPSVANGMLVPTVVVRGSSNSTSKWEEFMKKQKHEAGKD